MRATCKTCGASFDYPQSLDEVHEWQDEHVCIPRDATQEDDQA